MNQQERRDVFRLSSGDAGGRAPWRLAEDRLLFYLTLTAMRGKVTLSHSRASPAGQEQIALCLHLLGGAREDGIVARPAQLCLLTFTDKAAAELRTRLRQRLDGLATGESGDQTEGELRGSFARHGRPFPPPPFWRQVRDELGAASIGMFHSLCTQLIRRAPAGFGADPGYELLEERDALGLMQDTAERVVLEALDRNDVAVAELCRELGFEERGRSEGLVNHLCRVFIKLREEGLAPERVEISDPEAARRDFDEALAGVREAAAASTGSSGWSSSMPGRFAASRGRSSSKRR